jgi:Fe2+ or Zn2+ uptake regulation protein
VRRSESDYINKILSTTVYKSGACFPAHEIQRCLSRREGTVGVSRLREVANIMVERGMLTSKRMPNGEIYYQAATGSTHLLRKLWARPVSHEHSPRWC